MKEKPIKLGLNVNIFELSSYRTEMFKIDATNSTRYGNSDTTEPINIFRIQRQIHDQPYHHLEQFLAV